MARLPCLLLLLVGACWAAPALAAGRHLSQAPAADASYSVASLLAQLDPPLVATVLGLPPAQQAILLNATDVDYLRFAHALECETAEHLTWAAYGRGMVNVTQPGPPATGVKKANLTLPVQKLMEELVLVQNWHVEIFRQALGAYAVPCPQMNPGPGYAAILNTALNTTLDPPFDVFANDVNWLLGLLYLFESGANGYIYAVETAPFLRPSGLLPASFNTQYLPLAAKLLKVEGNIAGMVRTLLYTQYLNATLTPYTYPVVDVIAAIATLRRNVNGDIPGINDFGLVVPYTAEDLALITPPGILPLLSAAPPAAAAAVSSQSINASALADTVAATAPWQFGQSNRTNVMDHVGGLSYARNPYNSLQINYGNYSVAKPDKLFPQGIPGIIT